MRIEELVSDWELEEIRQELRSGMAPDIVAFRHGIDELAVREYRRCGPDRYEDFSSHFGDRWTEAERSFVRDNYPNHGKSWPGWDMLKRTWVAIRWYAHRMGVKRKGSSANEGWRKSNWTMTRPGKGEV